jgi:hypothetical protein
MSRTSAATVQKPGRTSAATVEDAEAAPAEPQGVAAVAQAKLVEGAVDPTTLRAPVFTEDGWLCPEPKPKAE